MFQMRLKEPAESGFKCPPIRSRDLSNLPDLWENRMI